MLAIIIITITIIIVITTIDEYKNMFTEYIFKGFYSIVPFRQIISQLIYH